MHAVFDPLADLPIEHHPSSPAASLTTDSFDIRLSDLEGARGCARSVNGSSKRGKGKKTVQVNLVLILIIISLLAIITASRGNEACTK